jgi:hypothetical protein
MSTVVKFELRSWCRATGGSRFHNGVFIDY